MRLVWISILLSMGLGAGQLVKRDVLKNLEAGFRDGLRTREMEIIAFPNALYIDGVGLVMTSEVNLTYAPMVTPFQQVFTPEYKARIHDKELKQLPFLYEEMKQTMLRSSAALEAMPGSELIIVDVKVSHQIWEDKTGVPEEITMRGTKAKLLEAKSGKTSVDSAIKVQEQ